MLSRSRARVPTHLATHMPTHVFITLVTALLVLATVACQPASEPEASAGAEASSPALSADAIDAAVGEITGERLREHIAILADDDMAGRGPGSEGDLAARKYLADQMQALGMSPAGVGGSWEQPFDIVSVSAESPKTWRFDKGGKKVDLAHVEDFVAFSGVQDPIASIDGAEVVFVGYGIQAPEYGWDDYKDVDVAGKVLLMLNNDPDWDDDLFEGDRRLLYGRWTYKYEKAAEMGAVGAIVHHTRPSAGYPFSVVSNSWSGPQFELPATGEARIQIGAWTVESATRRLTELAGQDLDQLIESARSKDFQPVPLGVTTSLELTNTIAKTETANVLGMLPGDDPQLRDEVVIYGAHYDHLGVGAPDDTGDDIYNGAVDNAAGVSQLLVAGKAFTALPHRPRRSVMLAFWGAEEQGLLGSRFFADNPTIKPGRMAANINVDGGNIWGPTRDVVFIGYGKSNLDAVVGRFAGSQEREVKPDQFPDRGFFYRSDQFNLARIGVPAIYLDAGTDFVDQPEGWGKEQIEAWENTHYHQPSDELEDDWNFDGMVNDTELIFRIGADIADSDELPRWTPGDEFEAARKAALAALP